MSLLAQALQAQLAGGLISVSGRQKPAALPDLIVSPKVGYDVNFNNRDKSIILDFQDSRPISEIVAADCCRLSAAAFQSIASINTEMLERDGVPWCMVKLYYAAFYACHTLMRLFGEGCSYFYAEHTARIIRVGNALGRQRGFSVDSGLYQCAIVQNGTALRCIRAPGVGSHDVFWEHFGVRLGALAQAVLSSGMPTTDAQTVFVQLGNFRDSLSQRGRHSWLSFMRNEMQYRHQFDVWFPSKIRASGREILSRLSVAWKKDPMDITLQPGRGGTLGEFVASCTFAVAFCQAMLDRIAYISPAGTRSFVNSGPVAYLNDVRQRLGA